MTRQRNGRVWVVRVTLGSFELILINAESKKKSLLAREKKQEIGEYRLHYSALHALKPEVLFKGCLCTCCAA